MEFNINIVSDDEDFSLQQVKNLKNWIEDDEDLETVKVKQERKDLEADDAGGFLMAALNVVIGPLLEPLANTIQVWMQEKTKRSTAEFSIEMETTDGKKFKINSKNIGTDEKVFVRELMNRFEGKEDYDYKITESGQ